MDILNRNIKNNLSFLNFDNQNVLNIFTNNHNSSPYKYEISEKYQVLILKYKNRYLYSKLNPYNLIENHFYNSDKSFLNFIAITNGIGLIIKYLLENKFKNLSNVFLIFLNPKILPFFFKIIELNNLNFNLTLIVLKDNLIKNTMSIKRTNNLYKTISIIFTDKDKLISTLNNNLFEISFVSFNFFPELINDPLFKIDKKLIFEITRFIQYKIKSLNSISHFSKRWKNNILHNLAKVKCLDFYKINALNKNILIFASSPNTELFLETNKNILNSIKNEFIIFCLPSTLTLLKLYNIKPDFLFTFDGSFFNYFNFPEISNYNILTSLLLYHSIIKNKKNNYYFISLHTPIEDIIYKDIDLPGTTFHGSSVNTLISYLNKNFHDKKILIIGSDYKNINNRSHHRYYQLYTFQLKKSNFFNTSISWETKVYITSISKYSLYKNELQQYSRSRNIIQWEISKNKYIFNLFNNKYKKMFKNENINSNNKSINSSKLKYDKLKNNKLNFKNKDQQKFLKSCKYQNSKINRKILLENLEKFSNFIDSIILDINYNKNINLYKINLLTFLFTTKIINNLKNNNQTDFTYLINDLKYFKTRKLKYLGNAVKNNLYK